MDYIDYQQKLGLNVNDTQKVKMFLAKIYNRINKLSQSFFDVDEAVYEYFFDSLGIKFETWSPFNKDYDIFTVLLNHTNEITDFLYYYVVFLNALRLSASPSLNKQKAIDIFIECEKESHLAFEFIDNGDLTFIFPKGAKELDTALISEPLEWLQEYPKSRKTYCIALQQYSDGIYIRDVADNLRKALEEFLQEFLGNSKNLSNNAIEIFKYINTNNGEPELSGMIKVLLQSYDTLNNKIAKHHDKVDKTYLEFLLHQTGLFIRMLIVVRQSSNYTS